MFFKGTRIRLYGVGLNTVREEDDYYEYMLVEIPGNPTEMSLVCVEGFKSGGSFGLIKTRRGKIFAIEARKLRRVIGEENAFVLDDQGGEVSPELIRLFKK